MKKDKQTLRAKSLGFRARSIFKLFEINKKFNLIKEKDRVLDLGCWPGSWLQFCSNLNCTCVGVDLRTTEKIKDCTFIKGDVHNKEIIKKIIKSGKFDIVLSDLAPKTTGIKDLDQDYSTNLALRALEISNLVLKNKGNFLCKIFQSKETNHFTHEARKCFDYVKIYKPMSSKKRSKEVYVIAKSKHNLNV